MRKLPHLQILRALAASLVVADHAFGALQYRGIACDQYIKPAWQLGHIGVSAFFVLSGLIVIRQSRDDFGVAFSPVRFMGRRVLRIVPMYWLATLLWFASSRSWGQTFVSARTQLLSSLFFIPNYVAHHERLTPILEPGWTLNYEMSFYLLFSVALVFRRRLGTLILVLLPEVLVAIGHMLRFPAATLRSFYTDEIMLCLVYGVMIGFLETELPGLPQIRWRISPAFLLLLPATLLLIFPLALGGLESWELLTLFSVLVILACTLTAETTFGWFGRTMVLLGDASFSTYLFHLFVQQRCFDFVARVTAHWHATAVSPVPFALFTVVVSNVVGLLIYLGLERPLTRWLRELVSARRRAVVKDVAVGSTPSYAPGEALANS